MKRSPMARGSGFAHKARERPVLAFPAPIRRVACTVISSSVVTQPKASVVRSEAYRRLVAAMPCIICGISSYSQAAHPNFGKGGGIKTDDRFCFAACCDRPGVRGCHPKLDQGALYAKEERRRLEVLWSQQTQDAIKKAGTWPAGLDLI